MTTAFTPDLLDLIEANRADGHRPLLFANARIVTGDSLIGDIDRGDVLLGGSRVVGIGPGLLTAADDDGAIVIDCDGHVIVPVGIDTAGLRGLRPESFRSATAIAPGNPADFAILPAAPGESEPAASRESSSATLRRFLASPEAASTIVLNGDVVLWGGQRVHVEGPAAAQASETGSPDRYLGTWIDQNDFVHQHLTADGRYDETRGGRPHAFQGDFWITGDRIDYRDDLGFWAFGEFVDGTLHHAGYTFHRS